jgi:hypothetical protein
MKPLLALLINFLIFLPIMASETPVYEPEVILPASPPQKVFRRFQTDFDYHHDRGFFLSAVAGPQWNHSVANPSAKGVRFGGKINLGGFVTDGLSIFGSGWGSFLESASLVAIGPGMAYLFDSTNIGLDLAVGIGRAFNPIKRDNIHDFSETVMAGTVGISKLWWLSGNTSMGISLYSGAHGLTLSEGKLSSFGWNAGLGLAFLVG